MGVLGRPQALSPAPTHTSVHAAAGFVQAVAVVHDLPCEPETLLTVKFSLGKAPQACGTTLHRRVTAGGDDLTAPPVGARGAASLGPGRQGCGQPRQQRLQLNLNFR